MDFFDVDDGDLLSRVLEQAREPAAPAARKARTATVAGRDHWAQWGILGSTRVTTSFGHVPAELVRVGDTLRTRDGAFERVQKITDLKIDEAFLERHPDAAPVLLRRNSLQSGVPHQDVGLSPAQMVAVGPNRFEDHLVSADTLSRERGAIDKTLGMIVYIQLHLAREAQINCDGVWVAAATLDR